METQSNPNPNAVPSVSALLDLENFFDTYLHKKIPFQLPLKAKEFIVHYGPWISLILLILAAVTIVPLLLLALGLSVVATPYAMMVGGYHASLFGWLNIVIGLAVMVMEGMAIPGLLKRSLAGWHMVYYATLLSTVGSVLTGNIISAVISLAVGMYFLFQIREYYK